MLTLNNNFFVEHHPNTSEYVRRAYNLNKPGQMDEAIDRLDEWIKTQPHFLKKDFGRDYLEILIITNKGSVERAKNNLNKLCAVKTYGKELFTTRVRPIDMDCLEDSHFAPLSRLTKDHDRVCILRNNVKIYGPDVMPFYCIQSVIMLEFMLKYNYSMGMIFILDYREAELAKLVTSLAGIRSNIMLILKGYQLRIKALHIISTSKLVEGVVAIVKSVVKQKVLERIHLHSDLESLYQHVDKDMLPSDYGGKEKPLKELSDEVKMFCSTDKNIKYVDEMFQATIDPSKITKEEFNESFLGMPGTFRTLHID